MSESKELDLMERDPNQLNSAVKVEFNDVLGEPPGAHSAPCVWQNSYACFNCGRNCGYSIMTFCFGIWIALAWGCVFAAVSFSSIWLFTPYMRLLSIILAPARKMYAIFLGTFVAPAIETTALIFGRIHVTNAQGQPPKPLGQLEGSNDDNVKNF